MEFAAITETLLIDADGVHDRRDVNDRMLPGMKSTLGEVEPHVMAQRLAASKKAAAARGELRSPLPVGFVHDPAGKVVIDPDAEVQAAIRDLFEIVADVREGLLAMAVGNGLQVMDTMMNADVTAACEPKGRHDPHWVAVRHGSNRGSVTLGGRRVPVTRPRIRATDGSGELPIPSCKLFTSTELLGRMAMAKILAGISTRRYPVGLEPVEDKVERAATATSKSAISRRVVKAY
jgi:hypothetical protein